MSSKLDKWQSTTSSEICEYITSGSRDWKSYYSDHGALFVRTQDISHDRLDLDGVARVDLPAKIEGKRSLIKPGDLLIAITGYTGRVGLVPDEIPEGYVSQSVGLMRLKDPRNAAYLYYFLQSEGHGRKFLKKVTYGIGRPVLSLQNLRDIPVSLPPLPTQYRIVAEIEKHFTRLDAGVRSLKRVQTALKRYRACVLKAACEGRLVPTEAELARKANRSYETGEQLLQRILKERREKWNGKGKYKEPARPNTTKLPPLPVGWTWLTVETVGFVTKLAGFEYTKFVKYDPDGDLAVIKAENAGRNGFKPTDFSRIKSSTVSNLTRSRLKPGDLLMVFVGAGTGNVARVPEDQPYFLGPNIGMIRTQVPDVSPVYLELFLRSPVGNTLALGFAKAVAQPSLSMGTIRMIPVALPPLAEQRQIVAEVQRRLTLVDEVERTSSTELQRATRLRQSILQCAFDSTSKGNKCRS